MAPRRADFGVIGFGRFGRFCAEHLATRGEVRVYDRRWGSARGLAVKADPGATTSGAEQGPIERGNLPSGLIPAPLSEVCQARVVIFAVPIRVLRDAIVEAREWLLPHTLVADTASVKSWPARWLAEEIPEPIEIVATHPLFGPDSAAEGLAGLRIALVPVRLRHPRALREFLGSFGLQVLVTTAAEHDRDMAETQSLVHWIGRALERNGASSRDLDTTGYRRLLEILGYVSRDSWELFEDLQHWNPYAAASRQRLLRALAELDQDLPSVDPPPGVERE